MKAWIAALGVFLVLLVTGCGISGSGDPTDKTGDGGDGELRIEDIEIVALSDSTATLSWKTTEQSASTLLYAPGSSSTSFSKGSPLGTTHVVSLDALAENTMYYYTITASDGFGKNAQTEELSFRTEVSPDRNDDTPPVIQNVRVIGITMVGATITWETDDRTTGIVRSVFSSGSTFEEVSTPANEYARRHTVTLSRLDPNTTYTFAVEATNRANLTTRGAEAQFETVSAPTLSIYPEEVVGTVTQPVTFEVRIEDSANLAGLAFEIVYPSRSLQITSITPGPFHNNGGHVFAVPDPDFDPITANFSWIVNFENGTPVGARSGSSGTVATIKAKATGGGSIENLSFRLLPPGGGQQYDYENPNNATRLLDHNRQPMPVNVRNATLVIN